MNTDNLMREIVTEATSEMSTEECRELAQKKMLMFLNGQGDEYIMLMCTIVEAGTRSYSDEELRNLCRELESVSDDKAARVLRYIQNALKVRTARSSVV